MAIAELDIGLRAQNDDGSLALTHEGAVQRWAPTVLERESVSLTGSAFVALSPPAGATLLALLIPATATSLTLKGETGDGTGIAIVPSSNFTGLPVILPLGNSPSIGILNDGSTVTVTCLWL